MKKIICFISALAAISACKIANNEHATLVIKNAHVWTAEDSQPTAEAVAVQGDSIIFVGSNADVEKFISDKTEIIDAQGKLVTPGFIDSHVHINDGGTALASVQLRDAATKSEFIKRIADFAKTLPKGEWIVGGTWDHSLWGGELPQASWIDSVTKDNPVVINRLDGHMVLANTLAMKAAGLSAATKEIPGGEMTRDANGNLLGIFKENAQDILYEAIPAQSAERRDKASTMAIDYLVANGVTSAHNMGTWDDVASFRRLEKSGQLKMRLYACVPLRTWRQLAEEVKNHGSGTDWVKIGGLKGFVDGALGSHTAAMLEPYTDEPSYRGIYITPLDTLQSQIQAADKAGLHCVIHAIGDEAIRNQLNIFERVEKANGNRDRRFRIEHAQHVHPADFQRFASLKVIPAMQPYHAIDDGRWAENYIGKERAKGTYAFKSFLDAGVKPALGSDWFVAPPDVMYGLYAAVTRRTLDDKNPGGWQPEQKITLEQALRGYTIDAAYAAFDETKKGSIRRGKLADLVIIDRDLFKIAPETLRDAKIYRTIVGGKIVYQAK